MYLTVCAKMNRFDKAIFDQILAFWQFCTGSQWYLSNQMIRTILLTCCKKNNSWNNKNMAFD